jgi:acetyl/propionyl-CoA carboxylase alpha subunit
MSQKKRLRAGEQIFEVELSPGPDGAFKAAVDGRALSGAAQISGGEVILTRGGRVRRFFVARGPKGAILVARGGRAIALSPEEGRRGRGEASGELSSPMPGKLIRVVKAEGERVLKGEPILVVVAMKMELPIRAPRDAVVKAIRAKVGERVAPGVPLAEIE